MSYNLAISIEGNSTCTANADAFLTETMMTSHTYNKRRFLTVDFLSIYPLQTAIHCLYEDWRRFEFQTSAEKY